MCVVEDPSLLGCEAVLLGEIDTPCLSAHLFFLDYQTLKMKTLRVFRNIRKYTVTHFHIPEALNLQQYCSETDLS